MDIRGHSLCNNSEISICNFSYNWKESVQNFRNVDFNKGIFKTKMRLQLDFTELRTKTPGKHLVFWKTFNKASTNLI